MKRPAEKDVGYINRYGGVYEEDFDINKIVTGKYEVRKRTRTEEHINQLAEDIRRRGQLECVHIVLQGNVYNLIAGYSRYFALKKIGARTIRALIYSNLSEADINAFAVGTNEYRVAISAWEKICVVNKFQQDFPDIPKYPSSRKYKDGLECIQSIFAIGRRTLQRYNTIYNHFSKNKKWLEYIEDNPNISVALLEAVYMERGFIKSDDTIANLVPFLEKLKIDAPMMGNVRIEEYRKEIKNFLSNPSDTRHQRSKWESAEKIVKDDIKKMEGIAKVNDVSRQNMGYDLEVITSKGEQLYIETKSVSSIGEPFTLTNNEYSCASEYKEKYIIAVVDVENRKVKYIRNPSGVLNFERRAVQWEWRSDKYEHAVSGHIAILPE